MQIASAQINTKIGDILYNRDIILGYIARAKEQGCDIICFPELALTGYPPGDLLYNPKFIRQCKDVLEYIAEHANGIAVFLGAPYMDEKSNRLTNSCIFLKDKQVHRVLHKGRLTNTSYFNEYRYFREGGSSLYKLKFGDIRLGIYIGNMEYTDVAKSIFDDIDIMLNMAATPYFYGRQTENIDILAQICITAGTPIIYTNMVGGNNDLVFNGGSLAMDSKGHICAQSTNFREDLLVWEMSNTNQLATAIDFNEDISFLYKGLVLGLRDYCRKLGVEKILLGLSGGIDSALVACLATEAVGKENILAVENHSKYTSPESRKDARDLINNLGIASIDIPIDRLFNAFLQEFSRDGKPIYDIAEENIQARIRGDIWMFISNREGYLVISGSNKSELSIGYTTLYGDMCSGLAPIGDIYKTQVYSLCEFINKDEDIIPSSILIKAPSAELRPDQKDEESLPPYEILDDILYMYFEEGLFEEEIIGRGYDKSLVYNIIDMIGKSEYKRYQAAPTIKVSRGWLTLGRQMPIVHGYSSHQ
ncbi:MAG: NAD+ synthase [Clostridiales bacterium]|nr:NAD+ synthase [Clostridiales bacterium]